MFNASNNWNMDILQQTHNQQNHTECFTAYVIMVINGNTRKIVQCLAPVKNMHTQMKYLKPFLPYDIDHIENEINQNPWSLVSSYMIFNIDDH